MGPTEFLCQHVACVSGERPKLKLGREEVKWVVPCWQPTGYGPVHPIKLTEPRTGAHRPVALACAEVGRCLRDAAAPRKRDVSSRCFIFGNPLIPPVGRCDGGTTGAWASESHCGRALYRASTAKVAATRSVTVAASRPADRSGSDIAHLSLSRAAPSARLSSVNSCVTLTLFVGGFRTMAETIRSGGSGERVLQKLIERRVEVFYSHAKQPRFQTSAQPSPPVSLRAPRSKQYHSPAGSASAGVGSPSRWLRSMTCSFDAERSFNSYARHLAMNSTGVIAPTAARTWTRTGIADRSRVRMTRRRSSMHHSPFPSCSGHHTVTSCDVQARLRRPRLGPPSVVASTTVIAWPHR